MAANALVRRWVRWFGVALALVFIVYVFSAPNPEKQQFPERTVVRFWHRWGGEWARIVQTICDDFNKSQEEYEVIPLSVPSYGADFKFVLAVTGGDPPDVMSFWNGALPSLAQQNLLTPLSEMMSPEEYQRYLDESYPVIRDSGMVDGKLYGITIGADMYALYVRTDFLEEAGLDPDNFPTTLEGLEGWGRKLTKRDKGGNITRLGLSLDYYQFTAYCFGGGFYDFKTRELLINTPENLAAMQWYANYFREYGFDAMQKFSSGLNTGSDTGGWPFLSGAYAVTLDGQWRVEEIRKYAQDIPYRIIPVPPPKNGKELAGVVSGNFMVIPTSAKQKKGAWEFIKFWTGIENREIGASCYNRGGWLPYSPKITETKTFQAWLQKNPQFQAFIDIIDSPNCKTMPEVPYLQFLNDQTGRASDFVKRGNMTPKAAIEMLETNMREELKRRKELGYDE
ncbi:MAG: ABC transporter substrate-binding protein [Fimbriimonadaceae bacterium]|nr:ABC transporter substrate-binding protein [Fimbriimonadaceae bacterium]